MELSFEGQPPETIEGSSASKLTQLLVKSQGCKRNRRPACISSRFSRVFALRSLQIGVTASGHAWTKALASVSNLEELHLTTLPPCSLPSGLLEAFLSQSPNRRDWNATSAVGEWLVTLCPLLKVFWLQYDRWLRSTEQFTLTSTLMVQKMVKHKVSSSGHVQLSSPSDGLSDYSPVHPH